MFGTAGTDLGGYRKDDKRNPQMKVVTPRMEDINPKKLKMGDGGKKNPKQVEDVKSLQKKLINLGFLEIDNPTGYFGSLTQKALDSYSNTLSQTKSPTDKKTQTKSPTDKKTQTDGGFILIWAYPEYEPKIDGKTKTAKFFGKIIRITSGGGSEGTYGKLGHGGCVVVENNGNCISYEFGRYPGAKEGYGIVLTDQLGKIAKIQDGKLLNAKQIASSARAKSYPPGPSMKMKVAVVKLPNTAAAKNYASTKQREYLAADFIHGDAANCGTFARDVADAGGVDVDTFCFPNPTSVVKSFDDNAIEMFDI
jgi:peptidoglycan hydrolase-like protein with peptidoglycan-binding domain